MAVSFQCPDCSASYQADASKVGRIARCKKCGSRFEVAADNTLGSQTSVETHRPPPLRKNKKKAPQKLGRFEIRSKLGAGAFGAVYRAYDPTLDREVALKVPHAGVLESEQDKTRYLREPKAAAQLRHPNIVPLHDANFDGDTVFIASAFIDGQTLKELIARDRPDFRASARMVMNLASALEYAHGKGIVHRDVKPGNIMVGEDGEPMLMDFGLAQFQEAGTEVTVYGHALGTPAYMPPEQARGDLARIGPASDQYSLGAVLYHLLTGERLFDGPPDLVISLVKTQEPKKPREHNSTIPRDLETICLRCLSKEPSARYASCQELADDLGRWLRGEPIRARRISTLERSVRWCRRNPVVATLVVSVMLVLAGGAAVASYFAKQAADRAKVAQEKEALAIDAAGKLQDTVEQLSAEKEQTKAADERTEQERLKTELERQRAKEESDRAERERIAKLEEQKRADDEKRKADLEAEKAEQQRILAEQRARLARLGDYNVQLARARALWDSAPEQALELLNDEQRCPPEMREFTWGLLHRLCQRELFCFPAIGGIPTCATFARDGVMVAVCDQEQNIVVWDVAAQERTCAVRLTDGRVGELLISPNGGRVAAQVALTKEYSVWDTAGGKLLGQLPGHSLAFSDDGRRAATVGQQGRIMLWDLTKNQPAATLVHKSPRGGSTDVSSVTFSPDGRLLASCTMGDGHTVLWDTGRGAALFSLMHQVGQNQTSPITAVAFSPDSQTIASVSPETSGIRVQLWRTTDGQRAGLAFSSSDVHGGRVSLAFSPDGKTLAAGNRDGKHIQLWDLKTGNVRATIQGWSFGRSSSSYEIIAAGSFAGDSLHLAGCNAGNSNNSSLVVWDTRNGNLWRTLGGTRHNETPIAATFLPNGNLVSVSSDGNVRGWLTQSTPARSELTGHSAPVHALSFSSGGQRLASVGGDRALKLWDVAIEDEVASASLRAMATGVATVPGSDRLVASGKEKPLAVWSISELKEQTTIDLNMVFHPLAVSADGSLLAAGEDSVVMIWDLKAGRVKTRLRPGTGNTILAVAFSPDGKRLAAGGEDKAIRIWDVASGAESQMLPVRESSVRALAFSPDGAQLVSSVGEPFQQSVEPELIVWNTTTWTKQLDLKGHARCVHAVAFSPDGKTLASAGVDGLIRLWDPQTGQLRMSLAGHSAPVLAVAFSPDGRLLASGSEDRTIRLWEADAWNDETAPASKLPDKTPKNKSPRKRTQRRAGS